MPLTFLMQTRDDNQLRNDAEKLADIFTVMQRSFVLHLSKELTRGNVSFPQYLLLGFLSQHEDPLTMTEVALTSAVSNAASSVSSSSSGSFATLIGLPLIQSRLADG
jgi:hypothetical protein